MSAMRSPATTRFGEVSAATSASTTQATLSIAEREQSVSDSAYLLGGWPQACDTVVTAPGGLPDPFPGSAASLERPIEILLCRRPSSSRSIAPACPHTRDLRDARTWQSLMVWDPSTSADP